MKLKITKRQAGFVLNETSLAIAIVAIIGAAAVAAYFLLRSDSAVNDEATELPVIVGKIQSAYSNVPDYSSVTGVASLVGMGVFPAKWVSGSGSSATVSNRWGGQVYGASASYTGAPAAQLVQLTYTGVPQDACKTLVPRVADLFFFIGINGQQVKNSDPAAGVGGAYSPGAVGTNCTGTTNTLVFDVAK